MNKETFNHYCDENIRPKQTKPLNDDEIIEMVKEHFIGAIKLGIVLSHDNVLGFARAIEKRHGIK
jgi:hypothetical protein